MSRPVVEQFRSPPAPLRYMSRALFRSPLQPRDPLFRDLTVRWNGVWIRSDDARAFREATGLPDDGACSVLHPHVFGFRLQMALLTHPAFPLPIWKALQIRGRFVRHRAFDLRQRPDLETQVGGHRFMKKGVEVDVTSRLTVGLDCHWESSVTYFYRGIFAAPQSPAAAQPSGPAPDLTDAAVRHRFRLPGGGGMRFGTLTGDYNGIHLWRWYARRLGFPTAFLHPQRAAGLCMSRLDVTDAEAQTLDLFFKGPVFYGADAQLKAAETQGGVRFGLSLDGDHRVALAGHWRSGASPCAAISSAPELPG